MGKKLVKAEQKDLRKQLSEVEDKLMDFIPESEKGTDRADCLDRITSAMSDTKLTDEELSKLIDEGNKFLQVETEKKKANRKAKTAKKTEEPKTEEPKAEKPKTEKPKKVDTFEFPEELKNEDEVYKQTEVAKVEDFAVGDLIATQWTEEQLKDYDYDTTGVLGQPKKFDKDIDVLVVVSVVEDKIVWGQSIGTGLMFFFRNKDIKKMSAEGMPFRAYKQNG